ncbi:MAG: hypothetical protein OXC13_15015 [Caldilineaceae bacterium]|nr:hypothetical protein [Caldilineaceae bacterium]
MTTIIGMICSNGVVLGADSASSLPPGSEEHTYEITKQKIWISKLKHWRMMAATAGHAARGDWMKLAIERYFKESSDHALDPIKRACEIRNSILRAQENLGYERPMSNHALIVFAAPDSCPNQILMFSGPKCQPQYFDHRKPFVAIGSGRRTAEPFLEFLRDVFWKEELPSIAEALVYVGWALMHTVSTQGSGSGLPINMCSISSVGSPVVVQGEEANERFSRLMQRMKEAMQGVVHEFLTLDVPEDDRGISKLKKSK